jgi:HlyD family secretion protein
MSGTRKVVIGLLVLGVVGVAAVASIARSQDRGVEVRMEEVLERDLISTITATGMIRARRQVNISSDEMGRVIELLVDEGDEVEQGQVLLRLEPTQFQAAVARARAALSQAEVQVGREWASLLQANRELERLWSMRERSAELVSDQALEEAETRVEVQRTAHRAAGHSVEQAQANLEEVEERLGRTTIRAPIAGRVTRLNIEEGEMAVVGTMNNPGSLLLTISDLAIVEAVLAVDETDVPRVSVGDSAIVELDAFSDRTFAGRVSRIGQSAIGAAAGSGQAPAQARGSVDFEVILTILDPIPELRPDLSATADIIVESRIGVPAVPIISVTVRDLEEDGDAAGTEGARTLGTRAEEGVYLVRNAQAIWQPVELGITGREYFEILTGVSVGDTVVSGPYQRIRALRDGDAVQASGGGSGDR